MPAGSTMSGDPGSLSARCNSTTACGFRQRQRMGEMSIQTRTFRRRITLKVRYPHALEAVGNLTFESKPGGCLAQIDDSGPQEKSSDPVRTVVKPRQCTAWSVRRTEFALLFMSHIIDLAGPEARQPSTGPILWLQGGSGEKNRWTGLARKPRSYPGINHIYHSFDNKLRFTFSKPSLPLVPVGPD